jgi:hypothetical protein
VELDNLFLVSKYIKDLKEQSVLSKASAVVSILCYVFPQRSDYRHTVINVHKFLQEEEEEEEEEL